uniref:Uncharacterized protein n=1 Tax=Sus scrofa TaxID=9823 RepID=A0A8D1FBS9_PIG
KKGASLLPAVQTGNSQVCSLLLRTSGAAPRVHRQEAQHHRPGCRPPSPAESWERPTVGEALESEPRTVSRRYLNSLKNKLSSGAWRKSCQPGTCPSPGTQVPEGWGRSGELGGASIDHTSSPCQSQHSPGWCSYVTRDHLKTRFTPHLLIKRLLCSPLLAFPIPLTVGGAF